MSTEPNTGAWPHEPARMPRTEISQAEERRWAMITHGVALAAMVFSAGVLGFVASVVIWVSYKDKGPFVRQHAANAVNIQIMTAILLAISAVLMTVLIGFVTYPLVVVWSFVLHLLALRKAARGEWYDPPLTPRIVR